ncbi:MAG: 2-oxoacid:acceptor oxidoreductase subunit alpha [Chlamydiae bacterium]|nr:2-oxoacid:acceptor oxidoreductase subunit alpha [Chlamydiota bacterium]
MNEFSVIIGGKAGFGINQASTIIASLFNHLGYNIYIYRDYPSLITGGHTFCIIRASKVKIGSHFNQVDFLLALNQETLDLHKERLKENAIVIFDSNSVEGQGIGLAMKNIVSEEKGQDIMRNTCIIGSFCKASGIAWNILEEVLKKHIYKDIELNLRIAKKGFDLAKEVSKIPKLASEKKAFLSGNDSIALGLIKAGLDSYIAYPMTPTSGILHFLAESAEEFNLKVIHAESELGAIIMALGFATANSKSAVGTSGGGFCLMTEGLSFSAMAEIPIVIVMGQRPGPATGLPTYTAQGDLNFVLHAGHGEFIRLVVAPGDAEESYYWSAIALNMAWKYQIPSIILTDKTAAEGTYSFDINSIPKIEEEQPVLWDQKSEYKRYLNTPNGVSPLAFFSQKNAVIKINSYEHDETGLAIEDRKLAIEMQDKRYRKEQALIEDLKNYLQVEVYGKSDTALICFGSNKWVCMEVAEKLNLKMIRPIVLAPFPKEEFKTALKGVKNLICVEDNKTSQLAELLKLNEIEVNFKINRYDGRPFSVDELEKEVKKVKI